MTSTSISSLAALVSPLERVTLASSSFFSIISPSLAAFSLALRLLSIMSLLGSNTTLTVLPP